MALQPWRTGKVIDIIQETHNTRRYVIQIPELEKFDFCLLYTSDAADE